MENLIFKCNKPECFRTVKNKIAYPWSQSLLISYLKLGFKSSVEYIPIGKANFLASKKIYIKSPLKFLIFSTYDLIYPGIPYISQAIDFYYTSAFLGNNFYYLFALFFRLSECIAFNISILPSVLYFEFSPKMCSIFAKLFDF